MADAGDTNRDGVHDILSGAERQSADTEGHAYLYSGRDGSLLHAFAGEATGGGAGDVDRDHRLDLLASAAEGNTVYMIAGNGRRGPRW